MNLVSAYHNTLKWGYQSKAHFILSSSMDAGWNLSRSISMDCLTTVYVNCEVMYKI